MVARIDTPRRMTPVVLLLLAAMMTPAAAGPTGFFQTNIVSDGTVPATAIDPDLVNPWGISFGPTSPFWIADNGTGLSTLYQGDGTKGALVVTIPPSPGSTGRGTPTGTAFNGDPGDFLGDRFLFVTEDGIIAGWQPSQGSTAAVRVDGSAAGAVYKDMVILGDRIYATDFHNGRVDVFDAGYNLISPGGGGFVDPNLPSGFAPFGIEVVGGEILVTFAKVDAAGIDDVPGAGNGFVDSFDAAGNLNRRVISNGPLDSPWGIALAPAGFGDLGGDLLVGNSGDGRINAFDLATGSFIATLSDAGGDPIVNENLWDLRFGNAGPGFDPDRLYFTAGLDDETGGLLGSLAPVPEPCTLILVGAGAAAALALRRRGRLPRS